MSKPTTPVLPYHSQDVIAPTPSPAPSTTNASDKGLISPPRTARTGVHWSVPNTPHTPKTMRTARTTQTNGTGRSSAMDTLEQVVEKLAPEVNVWDGEEPYDESEEEKHSTKAGSHAPSTFMGKFNHFRHHLRHTLHNDKFHYTIIGLVILDLVAVFLDLTLSLLTLACFTDEQLDFFASFDITNAPEAPSCVLHESMALTGADWFLWALSVFLLAIFVLEIFASLVAFGPKHFTKWLYAIDAIVVIASLIMEVYFKFADNGKSGNSPAALIVLRLWKIIRAIHAIAHSIELKNQSIIKAVREAMEEVQDEHQVTEAQLERAHLKVAYLMDELPNVKEDELEHFVDQEMEKRRNQMVVPVNDEDGASTNSNEKKETV